MAAGDGGEQATARLLILSQVVLCLQLPCAIGPLLGSTGHRAILGRFVNGRLIAIVAWTIAAVLIALNATPLFGFVTGRNRG